MQDSEGQFQELLAQAMARVQKLAARGEALRPIALILKRDGEVDTVIGAAEAPEQLSDVLSEMQTSLAERVVEISALAVCIALPEEDAVVFLLENHENYCVRIHMDLLADAQLDAENMSVENSSVYVFPIVD